MDVYIKIKKRYILHIRGMIQNRFIKYLVSQLGRNSHSQKIKVVLDEPLKQTLSLGNHQRRLYNSVCKSKTVLILLCKHAKLDFFVFRGYPTRKTIKGKAIKFIKMVAYLVNKE